MSDMTVTDAATGLTWEKLTEDEGIHCVRDRYTWDNATAVKIAALNEANFAGHSDWRLPTNGELLTLVDYERWSPACRSRFAPMQSGYYWSSWTYQGRPNSAFGVYFLDGTTGALGKTILTYVRAVRAAS